jgi:hypothetical protein
MNRLFVFGDSWAFNYFSKESIDRPELGPHLDCMAVAAFAKEFNYFGHWTDYLKDDYNVYNFAEGGCCNEDIIYQLNYLPEYKDGDRIIIIFTEPARFQWMVDGIRRTLLSSLYWKKNLTDLEQQIYDNQLVLRNELWTETNQRKNEKQFINKIPQFFKQYNPILISWNSTISDASDKVFRIPFDGIRNSITYESGGKYIDAHLGINGNYILYKFIGKKLGIKINTDFNKMLSKKII